MSAGRKLLGTTIITSIAASLCCITPILALIAGSSGIVSTFSWIEPFRPYLIALTILILAIAWFQKMKPKKQEDDCDCEEETPNFLNSKKFLLLVTLFAGSMLAFPYYTQIFYPNTNKEVVEVTESNINQVEYRITGMTCTACEIHIESEVSQLDGIIEVKANYEMGNTFIKYDKSKVTSQEIEDAIEKTGYQIIE